MILPSKLSAKIGLTQNKELRVNEVLKHCNGSLLDYGCGDNLLVKRYEDFGVGVDYSLSSKADIIVNEYGRLPFESESFDTISMIAVLNYIKTDLRIMVLAELLRVLKVNGKLVVTCIDPLIGFIRHSMLTKSEYDQMIMEEGGHDRGLSKKYVTNLIESVGFNLVFHKRFSLFLNNIYLFEKNGVQNESDPNKPAE